MKKVVFALALLVAGVFQAGAVKLGNAPVLKTTKDSLSYAIGLNAGLSFRQNLNDMAGGPQSVDLDMLKEGFSAGVAQDSSKFAFSNKKGAAIIKKYLDAYEAEKKRKEEAAYKASKANNDQYLDNKVKNDGFDEMLNAPCKDCHGTLIKKTKVTDGESISDSDYVCMNYTAKLTNGTVFDQSEDGAAVLPVDGVIDGLIDALVLMHKGEKATIIVPSELGYGKEDMGNGTIPANSILIFDVEILNIFHTDEEVDNYLMSIGAGSDNED